MTETLAVAVIYGGAITLAELIALFFSRKGIQTLGEGQIIPALLVLMLVATELVIIY